MMNIETLRDYCLANAGAKALSFAYDINTFFDISLVVRRSLWVEKNKFIRFEGQYFEVIFL